MKILAYSIFLILLVLSACTNKSLPDNYKETALEPTVFPDYKGVTIPPNIAPLNFLIEEEGETFIVEIKGSIGSPVQIVSKLPQIRIPIKKWNKLLASNIGKEITTTVFIKRDETWFRYQSMKQYVAKEEIDSYLTYRLINSGYILWNKMGLYQRDLESFDETPIIKNTAINNGCVNCHISANNDPNNSLFHIRAGYSGTLMLKDGKLEKVDTKTDYTMSAAVYPDWHLNRRHIAFSVNKINQRFYSMQGKSIEVSDKYSDLIVYDTETKTVTSSPKVSTDQRENLPEWSADGKSIYYISAPKSTNGEDRVLTQYSLVNIPYDVDSNTWGEVDTIISAHEIQNSITFPRASPDGRFLAFCMTDYGYFTIHHKNSDLYLLDLKTMQYQNAEMLNSAETESYHTWSTNSRWMVYSSRRIDGIHTRTFIAHIDENGKCGKPFVLPQKDPAFYRNYLLNFNRPELMTGKLTVSPQNIRQAVYKNPIKASFDSTVQVNALSGATKIDVIGHQ